MIRRTLLALALAACFAAPAVAQVSQSAPFVTAPGTYKSVDATNYSGADMCAKIAAAATALNTLAPAGGIIDARGFAGTQHCTTSPFAGWPSTNSWPVKLIMGAVDQTDVPVVVPTRTTVTSDFPFNEAYSGAVFGAGFQTSTSFPSGVTSTLSASAAAGAASVTVTSGTGFVSGKELWLTSTDATGTATTDGSSHLCGSTGQNCSVATITVSTGTVNVGDSIAGLTAGTVIRPGGTGTGGTGAYYVFPVQTHGSTSIVVHGRHQSTTITSITGGTTLNISPALAEASTSGDTITQPSILVDIAGTTSFAVQFNHMEVSCNPPSGANPTGVIGLRNGWSQENTDISQVDIKGCTTDLEIGGDALNAVRMHSLTMSDYGMPTTDTDFACMDVGEAYPYAPEWFDTEISDVSCGDSYSSSQTIMAINGANLRLSNIYIETQGTIRPRDGIVIGDRNYVGSGALTFDGIKCAGSVGADNCLHVGTYDYHGLIATSISGANLNVIEDDTPNGCTVTIAQAGVGLQFYQHDELLGEPASSYSGCPGSGAIPGKDNLLICGDPATCPMQRGTANIVVASPGVGAYGPDRWMGFAGSPTGGTMTLSYSATGGPNAQLPAYYEFARTSGSTNTSSHFLGSALTPAQSIALAGQQMSCSVWVKTDTSYSGAGVGFLFYATATGSSYVSPSTLYANATLTLGTGGGTPSGWTQFTLPAMTVPSTVYQIGAFLDFNPTGTASNANDGVEVSGFDCEASAVANTAYPYRDPQTELQKAQYFYQKTFPTATAPAQSAGVAGCLEKVAQITTAGSAGIYWPLRQPMFKTPAITTYNPSAANANWRDITGASDVVVSVDPDTAIGAAGVYIGTQTTSLTAGHHLCIQATADAD